MVERFIKCFIPIRIEEIKLSVCFPVTIRVRLVAQRPEPFDLFFAVGFFHEDVVLNGIAVFMYIANIALPVAVGFFE